MWQELTKLRYQMRESIYKHLLHFGIIQLRNLFELSQRDLLRTESARCIAELLHYIPPLLMNEAPGKGDVYFLEVGARTFIEQYPFKSETYFVQTADLLLELRNTLSSQMSVTWVFPSDVESKVMDFRAKCAKNKKSN